MGKYKVEFSHRANAQLRSIFSYIAEEDPNAALKLVEMLEMRARQLESTPLLGADLQQNEYPFLRPGYRRLVVKKFIMYYRVTENTVYVTHIIHARRNQSNALTDAV